ncbi:AAA family ATPase [Dactylosporangium sp. CA-139066]|uniref:AAA family ATPase n=1 Tax=Dactylosporangium sp. CA-139066 TaxID=3239930 RepID=UPI003D94FCCC
MTLYGRADDLAVVGAFLDHAAGDGGSLLITGDAGIGKTALLSAATELATNRGARVLRAAGAPFEGDLQFAGLDQVLRPLLGDRPGRYAEDGDATVALLREAAREQPLLIAIDDLHWVDPDSVAVLTTAELASSHVGLLAATRDEHGPHNIRCHRLRPLDDSSAESLLRDLYPALPADDVRRVLADARGNPLAIRELPMAPLRGMTRRLREAFGAPVAELSAPTRTALLLVALGDTVWTDALGPAVDAGLVTPDLTFRHQLTRSAVLELSTAADVRRAHAALARRPGQDPDSRAWHLAYATIGPDQGIADLLDQVARRARGRGDIDGAIAALRKAATLSPDGPGRSRRHAFAAYLGAAVAGTLLDVPQRLEGRDDPAGLAAALATAYYRVHSGNGDVDSAYRLLMDAVETALRQPDAQADVLAESLHTLDMIAFYAARAELPAAAARAAEAARIDPGAIRTDVEGATTALHAMAERSRRCYETGEWDEAGRLAEAGRRLSDQHGYRLLWHIFLHRQGLLAAVRGEYTLAEDSADAITRFAGPRRIGALLVLAAQIRARAALGRGDYEDAYLHATSVDRFQAPANWLALDLAEAAIRTGRRTHLTKDQARGAGPFDLARIRMINGERLRRIKQTQAARQELSAAAETFARLGAKPWAERANNELYASGLPAERPDPRLSPQQYEIARLAAAGLTNKQIGQRLRLSPRTVGTHLYQIFPKLGVTARAALRDALQQRG